MAAGTTNWPTFSDGLSVAEPQDSEALNGPPQTLGQYLRNNASQINALQADLGPSQNTPSTSLRGRLAIVEQTARSGTASGVGSIVYTYVSTGSVGGGRLAIVIAQRTDGTGTVQNAPWTLAVLVADTANPYGPAANGTITGTTNPNTNLATTVLKAVTVSKSLVLGSDSTGVVTLGITSTVVGDSLNVLAAPAFGSPALDYSNTFSLTTQA